MANNQLRVVESQTEPPPKESSNNGGGNNFGERLARLETRIEYLATKEDVSEVKVLIERKLNWVLYSMIGIMITTLGTLVTAVFKIWITNSN